MCLQCSTHRGRRLCKVEVSVQKHSDVVLAGLQGDGQRGAAVLQQHNEDELVKEERRKKERTQERRWTMLTLSVRVASQPGTDSS